MTALRAGLLRKESHAIRTETNGAHAVLQVKEEMEAWATHRLFGVPACTI
jgi:hypothetical protein